MAYPCPYCSTSGTYRNNLRTHLMGARARRGHELSRDAADAIIARIERGEPLARRAVPCAPAVVPRPNPGRPVSASGTPIRGGHRKTLALLEQTDDVRATLRAYEHATGHPVYLRPTDRGLTVISLDPAVPAMVGVGAEDDVYLDQLPPTREHLARAVRGYRAKIQKMRRDSAEERFVLGAIRRALGSDLRLEGGLLFLHQEWRFTTSSKLDMIAIDTSNGQLVVIEAKESAAAAQRADKHGRTAAEQAAQYAGLLWDHRAELVPFFERELAAMLRIYAPAMVGGVLVAADLPPRCEVWWPGSRVPIALERTAATPLPRPVVAVSDRGVSSQNSLWWPDEPLWRRRLRARQSAWREACGFPAGTHNGRLLGSRLRMPDAEEHLWNFLTPAIGRLVRDEYYANMNRRRGKQKMYGYPRLFDDLLSSQPMVFNLFGELALDLNKATAVARKLWPDRVDRITQVELEWSPGRWDPRYLDNGTAADVALFHTTPRGESGIVFVETKFHEDLKGADATWKVRYDEVSRASGAFASGAHASISTGALQQIALDHLLALATRQADGLERVLFSLVYPHDNPACRAADVSYRALLTRDGLQTYEARTIESLVDVIERELPDPWVRDFRARYLGG